MQQRDTFVHVILPLVIILGTYINHCDSCKEAFIRNNLHRFLVSCVIDIPECSSNTRMLAARAYSSLITEQNAEACLESWMTRNSSLSSLLSLAFSEDNSISEEAWWIMTYLTAHSNRACSILYLGDDIIKVRLFVIFLLVKCRVRSCTLF
jgi:hypothetical protein